MVGSALAGLAILVIGDSQMMGMLTNLHNQLEDNGAVVYSYAVCGSVPSDWTSPSTTSCGTGQHLDKSPVVMQQGIRPTWNLNNLIAQHHPNLIVVELGDTIEGYDGKMELPWIHQQLNGLTTRLAATKIACVWVGPTWGQDKAPYHKSDAHVQQMSQLLASSVSPCVFVDSLTFSRPGEWQTRDGAHLEPDGYRKWSTAIAGSIVRLKGQGQLASH